MQTRSFLFAAFILFAFFLPARAETGAEFGLRAGTLGAGAELGLGLNQYLGLRVGINYLKYSFDSTISDVEYDMEAEFRNGSLLLDFFPLGGNFKMTGGLFFNDNSIGLSGRPQIDSWLGDYASQAENRWGREFLDTVQLHGTVDFNAVAPYLGIGWDSNVTRNDGFGVAFELGVLYQGSPQVGELTVSSAKPMDGFANNPAVAKALEQERQEIEDDLEGYEYYPVVTLTLSYVF